MPLASDGNGNFLSLGADGQWAPAQVARNPETGQELILDDGQWRDLNTLRGGRANEQAGGVDRVVRSVAQGASFGFADEIAAGGDALLGHLVGRGSQAGSFGERYEQNLAAERGRDRAAAESNPIQTTAGNIVGAVGGGIAATPRAVVQGAATTWGAVGRLTGLGAAQGGVAGFGAGEGGVENRLSEAQTGAAFGGVAGAVAPAVGAGVVRAVRGAQLAASPTARAQRDLARAIVRDETTPEALVGAAREAEAVRPGGVMLADVGGENVRGLVERVAQTPGAGRTQVVPALTERQRGQMVRLVGDLRSGTGTARTALEATEEAMTQRATAARPLYDRAMEADISGANALSEVWQDVTSKGFGRDILRGRELRNMLATEHGITDPFRTFNMEVVDAWKRAADDRISAATRKGESNVARVLGQMRDRVVAAVDEVNPSYAEARNAWSGPSRYMDAITDGRDILNPKVSAAEMSAALGKMTEAEQEGFRIGAVSALVGRLENDASKLPDLTKYLRSPAMREKIAALMPDPGAAERWAASLDFEIRASELANRSMGNSATARRLAERADAEGGVAAEIIQGALRGTGLFDRLFNVAGAAGRRVRDTVQSRRDAALGRQLTEPGQAQRLQQFLGRGGGLGLPPSAGGVARGITVTNSARNALMMDPEPR